MNLKHSAVAVALAATLAVSGVGISPPAQATGIPVIDIANLMQSITRYTEMIAQLKQLEMQLEQAKETYSSMTGSRGFGSILQQNYNANIPTNWQGTLAAMQGGQVGQIANQIKQEASELSQPQFANVDQSVKDDLSTTMGQAANAQALNAQTYNDSANRFQQISNLMNQINTTTDPKGIAELQARIGVENANLTNELIKLQAMNAMVAQQQKVQQEHERQEYYKIYHATY